MSATRDVSARPPSQPRPSSSSAASSLLNRQSSGRPHSHSSSLGQINASNRVSRRKSSTSGHGVNRSALFAAAQEGLGLGLGLGFSGVARTSSALEAAETAETVEPADGSTGRSRNHPSAVVDGPPLGPVRSASKNRSRRASEGSRLIKERRKSAAGELKCETCGKGYKHGSCLQKHLWEHTPEWALTSKLLISKHQQVQMLEAASVLVAMNHDPERGGDALDSSDASSESLVPSGSSGPIDDEDDSSRTSSPEGDEEGYAGSKPTAYRTPRRQDSYSSVFSRSYQSTAASSLPNDAGFHHRRWSSHSRPSTGVPQTHAEEQADMAAAAEGLLNCSIGTPQFHAYRMESDVPPVPPLPAKFAQLAASPYLRPQHATDVDMSDDDRRHRAQRADDDDEGVFGKMEQ